jgi:hypothetical protein
MDELFERYTHAFQAVYFKGSADDQTFSTLLKEFYRELKGLEAVPHEYDCKIYGHALVVQQFPIRCKALETTTVFKSYTRLRADDNDSRIDSYRL